MKRQLGDAQAWDRSIQKNFHTSKIVHALGWRRQLSYRADSSPTISSSKRKRRIPGDDNDGDDWRDRCLSLSLLLSRSRAPDSSLVAVNKKRFPSPRDVRRKSVQFHSIPKWQIMMSLFGPFLILLLGLPLLAPNPPQQHPRRYCNYSALLYSESYWLKEIPNSYHSLCAVPFISENDHSLNGYLRRPSCDVTKVEILFRGQSAILQSLKKDTWRSQWYVRPSFQNQFSTISCFMGNTLFRLVLFEEILFEHECRRKAIPEKECIKECFFCLHVFLKWSSTRTSWFTGRQSC